MRIWKKSPNNFCIVNLIRRLIVKLIVKLDKLTESKKINSVLDEISIFRLFLHYLNFYKSYLPKKAKLYKKISLKSSNIFSIDKEMKHSLFFVDIKGVIANKVIPRDKIIKPVMGIKN